MREQPDINAILEGLPGLVYRCRYEPSRTFTYASSGSFALTGYTAAQMSEGKLRLFGDLAVPDDRWNAWQAIQAAVKNGKGYDLIYRIIQKNGGQRWVRDVGRAVDSSEGEASLLEGMLTDITDQKRYEQQLEAQTRRFQVLRTIDAAIVGSFDSRVTFDVILDQAMSALNLDAAAILILDPGSQLLHYAAGRGFQTGAQQRTNLRIGEGYAGLAALDRKTVFIKNLADSSGEFGKVTKFAEEGFHLYIGVPLIARGQVKGILELFHRTAFTPEPEWMEFVEILAGQAAIAIDNASMLEDLQQATSELGMAYDATLESWSQAQELRDRGTTGHNRWLAETSVRLAQAMKLNGGNLVNIRRGALLHDVGELAIPDVILKKPGPLSDEEREVIKQHPTYGYKLLSPIPTLKGALDIPYCHHERWDGKGYPRGLAENQIPLAARVFAVVHVWDALLSDRPYRPAWSQADALDYIERQRGKEFDPEVVDKFLSLDEIQNYRPML